MSAHAISVVSGYFRLFTADPIRTDTNNLVYELDLASVEGNRYKFTGFKVVNNNSKLDPARLSEQSTTLYVKIEMVDATESLAMADRKSNSSGYGTKSPSADRVVGLGILVSNQ